MIVYRITSHKFSSDISGTGAALYGGRWNKKGSSILYTGESKDIALLETVVHTPPMLVPNLDIVTLEIPDDSISELTISDLPINWMDYPAPSILAELAEQWILENKTIALKVPSCIIHSSHNYLLNCRHPDFNSKVKVMELINFHFDSRLSL
ncbi:MAG: RES domain-containing protein [Crocinitomix sp.]|jgi:RES domain-containing protein